MLLCASRICPRWPRCRTRNELLFILRPLSLTFSRLPPSPLSHQGLIRATGHKHANRRKTLEPLFASGSGNILGMLPLFSHHTNVLLEVWAGRQEGPAKLLDGDGFCDIAHVIRLLMSDVMSQCCFGASLALLQALCLYPY